MFSLTRYHNWLIFRLINPALQASLERYARGRLLDIGCGSKPYKSMVAPHVTEHVGLDHRETQHDTRQVDVFGTAYSMPLEACSFDTILCTDVLEHLEEPRLALAEAYRVLKFGGHAIYTVPFFWHLHEEPRDFFRYTKHGLRYLFESNGFRVLECKALSGYWVTVAQETCYYLTRFRRWGAVNPLWWIVPIIATLIQTVAYIINSVDRSEQFTIEYILVAEKPSDAQPYALSKVQEALACR